MKHNYYPESGLAAGTAADSYFSLPFTLRRHTLFRSTLMAMSDASDEAALRSVFREGRWLGEWLTPGGPASENTMRRRRSVIADVLGSTRLGRAVLEEELARMGSAALHPSDRIRLVWLARDLVRTRQQFWGERMWRALGDSFCLYATLDERLIRDELRRSPSTSASGSYQLLRGSRGCRELFFSIGFPYYASRRGDWAPFAEILRNNPWAWPHVLTLDMDDGLLAGMVRHLHGLPPSLRPPGAREFITDNRHALERRLGGLSYLLGSPSDYMDSDPVRMSALPVTFLLESGAVSYFPQALAPFPYRIGVVTRSHGGRVSVLCADSDEQEVRRALFEDLSPGDAVILHGTGAVALRRTETVPALHDTVIRLRSRLPDVRTPCRGSLPSPLSHYLERMHSHLDVLCAGAGVRTPTVRELMSARVLSAKDATGAMSSVRPSELAVTVFHKMSEVFLK